MCSAIPDNYYSTLVLILYMSSGQNPFTSVMVIAFGVGRFPGFCGSQHIRDPTWSQNPFPKQARKWIQQLFRWFQVLRQLHVPFVLHLFACMFLHVPFICMHIPVIVHSVPFMVLSCSFHVPFIGMHFHSCSFHIPFMFIPMCIHVLSFPFICKHVPFILHSCPFISFLQSWKWLDGLAREPSATNGYR